MAICSSFSLEHATAQRRRQAAAAHQTLGNPTSCSPRFADDVGESAALQVLHDHPELLLHLSAAEHLHHVLVPVVPHDHHLQRHGEGLVMSEQLMMSHSSWGCQSSWLSEQMVMSEELMMSHSSWWCQRAAGDVTEHLLLCHRAAGDVIEQLMMSQSSW